MPAIATSSGKLLRMSVQRNTRNPIGEKHR